MAKTPARILIVGGGFGGLFTALELAGAGAVTLVSPEDHFLFTPMLYEYLSGEVEAWHIAPHHQELFDDSVRFIRGEVAEIDLHAQEAVIEGDARRIAYDVLVLAVGGVTNYWNTQGAAEHAMPFRKLAHADALRQRMVEALDRVAPDLAPQDARRALTFAVVGAGASGVELSTKMSDLLRDAFQRRALPGEPRVMVIEMGDRVVPGMGEEIREFVEDALKEARVELHTRTRVLSVRADGLTFEHEGETTNIAAAATVWTGGVRINPLIEKLDLTKDKRGLTLVRPTLQTEKYENVFALGDIAFFPDASPQLAGTAQLALQQAGLAADNIKALLKGKELHTKHFEELGEAVSLGTERAAVLAGGKAFGGALARQARFALYTSRLPTWHHRLKVGASWFFEGTQPRPLQPLGLKR
jgi:NADH dehydrogenase